MTRPENNLDFPPPLAGFEHINRYWDKMHNITAAKILPGEYYVTTQNEAIVTVLGSCVSACVRDKVFGIGGMNHFMLPMTTANSSDAWKNVNISAATRYGNFAMEHLINTILGNGGMRENLEVKVFGGGRILAQMTDIGSRNISFVREYIATEKLALLAEDLGDTCPRKVMYNPITGKVKMKKLRSLHNNTIIDRETEYMQKLDIEPVESEIDLF
ncbi:chemoreceptor glutamine deamidase CheD [Sulfuriflexus sp.]|uniref:chemoreceptor glutamine deamidase CheD n=1 Tax=Sulfuriflexus sp. TaxID=2015443 RepID=UPI0028CF6384|nr:chemoreceptor glutamine deamidase CheD [Sulfuriflexus sp.]MDT8404573.1 chemoreceptor glutamine deamidase CheD [Sulfuriflexus sp.]